MNKETLAELICNYQGNDLAGFLFSALEQDKSLRIKAQSLKLEEATENEQHKLKLEQIRKKWSELINLCAHYESTFHGDPGGGHDSKTVCDICGKSW